VTLVRIAAVAALVLQLGCTTTFDRGTLAAVSTKAVGLPMKIVAQKKLDKRYCQYWADDRAFARVIEDALRKAPEANALAIASYTFKGSCIVVHGTAVLVD